MSEDDKGFEVRDRRKVREEQGSESGPAPSGPAGPIPEGQEKGTGSGKSAEAAGGDTGAATGGERVLPPVDFMSFIGSLAATAFMYMGERISPDQPETFMDLQAARQMIDLLDLIKTKTKGNLEQHEADGLDSILYNLRMRYLHHGGV